MLGMNGPTVTITPVPCISSVFTFLLARVLIV